MKDREEKKGDPEYYSTWNTERDTESVKEELEALDKLRIVIDSGEATYKNLKVYYALVNTLRLRLNVFMTRYEKEIKKNLEEVKQIFEQHERNVKIAKEFGYRSYSLKRKKYTRLSNLLEEVHELIFKAHNLWGHGIRAAEYSETGEDTEEIMLEG